MQSHDINRGYCRSILLISFATTFLKWSKNWNFEGQNVCHTQWKYMFGSCFELTSPLYVYQNRSYPWNFESPLKVSTLLAFTGLGSAPEGKFLAIWGALAGQYCQVSTSLSPIGRSLSAFELASKYVSSPWPCQPGAVATFSLCGARIGRPKESIWRFWALCLFTIAMISLARAPWDVVWMFSSLLVNMLAFFKVLGIYGCPEGAPIYA